MNLFLLVFTILCPGHYDTVWESDGEDVLSTTKICTGAKPFLKAYIKPFDITEMGMLPLTQESLVAILFLQNKKEGHVMFVRQTIIHTAIDKIDAASKLFEESVIPAFRSQKGYQGTSFISDRSTGKSICVSLWDSEQDAIANEQSHVYQEQLIKFMSLFTMDPFREGYELLVQDEK